MDSISLIGLTLGVAAILVGQVLEGGHISSLVQPTAFMIVIGGTLGAVMLQSPLRVFKDGIGMAKWIFKPPVTSHEALVAQVVGWSTVARREGLLALENQLETVNDGFTRKGIDRILKFAFAPNCEHSMGTPFSQYFTIVFYLKHSSFLCQF